MKKVNIIFVSIILLLACEKEAYIERNEWVEETMETYYLWEQYLPDNIDASSTTDTYTFFESLRYEEDFWSWISDDYYETSNMLSGITTTAGQEFSLYYLDQSENYKIKGIIEYVMKGSPAEKAGINRGDIFTRINGTQLTIDNYQDLLFTYTSYTIGFDSIKENQLSPSKEVSITEIENFQENPIYLDTIYHINGFKIGYMVYNSFLDEYNEAKSAVFEKFKAAGISDLILDLRYNNGGSAAAEEHLANLIAPQSAEGEIFAKDHWNRMMSVYLQREYGDDYFNTYIQRTPANIDLQGKLIGITSNSTASASEGLLNGLGPLVDLCLVGDTTHGKYTGMIVIPDDEDDPQWAIVPIVVKMTNKEGVSVKGGMAPKVLLDDNPLDGYALGDIRETMLSKAIEEITGVAVSRTSKLHHTTLSKAIKRFKGGKELEPIPMMVNLDKLPL